MMYLAVAIHDRDKKIIPTIVSLFTWSKAYHCELGFSDYSVISSDITDDVHFKVPNYDQWGWILLPLPWITKEQEAAIKDKATEIVANKADYDLLGAIFGKFAKIFDRSNAYYCTELCAELLAPYTSEIDPQQWYSPDELWKVISDKLAKEYANFTTTKFIKQN